MSCAAAMKLAAFFANTTFPKPQNLRSPPGLCASSSSLPAIDWILSSCTGIMGTTVGSSKFTDQDYADDAVLFSDCPSKWPYILSSFDEAAHTMGLHTSWSKTEIQNLGHGVTPAPVQLQGHVVESTDRLQNNFLAVISTRLSVPPQR